MANEHVGQMQVGFKLATSAIGRLECFNQTKLESTGCDSFPQKINYVANCVNLLRNLENFMVYIIKYKLIMGLNTHLKN